MNDEYLIALIEKYQQGQCTPEEKLELETWFEQLNMADAEFYNDDPEKIKLAAMRSLTAIRQKTGLDGYVVPFKSNRIWKRVAAAAAILLVCSITGYLLLNKHTPPQQSAQIKYDIAPGANKATLTLANGREIVLTDAKNGKLAAEDKTMITKTADGQLVYSGTDNNNDLAYNTMSTPRGGQYTLTLSDGTVVILNAASSLKYPASFTGNERKVELTGEAYFEVAHNKAKPFKVVTNGQTVEVLGTHFNIMAYNDEAEIKTTLLEGAVKLSDQHDAILLKPGQQGYISKESSKFKAVNVDVSEITAWKDGLFVFNGTDLHSLMRQLSRWYDVEVVYEPGVKDDVFFGKIRRKSNLSKVLKILELGDVHFSIEGRKLIVKN